ncbi:olfactory receptor 14I1-like [Pelodiscus sinensis]|uniref:olfactory receptor 14I1-like n=1 Tax=Pelodiscus sinensis TaxID=13735 RepID=UPI003F6C3E65
MSNQSSMAEFLLLGFSDIRELQILHFVLFLVLYLATLVGNLLIISAIAVNRQLHTPMYFFLGNLSLLDLGSISVTVPKSMANSLLDIRSISYVGCVAQVFLFVFFAAANFGLLTVMAYDRYVAICQPLHYERVMNRTACVRLAAGAWLTGLVYSALHTGNTFWLPLCQSNVIDQFFCELPQLLKLLCPGAYRSEVGVLGFSACLLLGCFAFIVVSYAHIFSAVLRIPSGQGRHKAFSTCLPHLIVISLFICTGTFAHLKPRSSSAPGLDLAVAVVYAVVPPMMNPVIYSMRNKEIKAALRRLTVWTLFTRNNMLWLSPMPVTLFWLL